MSSTSVSVVVPLATAAPRPDAGLAAIASYLETTGFTFEILTPSGDAYGSVLRRGVSDAKGGVIVVVDPDLPYPVGAIGDAVALIESAATDVVFGSTRATDHPEHALLRWIVAAILPDPAVSLMAFSSTAGKIVIGETRLEDHACDLEIAFLVNRYGFRIERLVVQASRASRAFGAIGGVVPAIRVRLANRNNAYRAPRRCPVCYSSEVWSCAQIPGNVVRACKRCKCRYLHQ